MADQSKPNTELAFTPDKVALLKSLGFLGGFTPTGATVSPEVPASPKENIATPFFTPSGPPSVADQKAINVAKQLNIPSVEAENPELFDFFKNNLHEPNGTIPSNLLTPKSLDDSPQYPNSANGYGKLTTEPLMILPSKDTNEQKDIGQDTKTDSSKGTQRKPALSSKLPSKSVEQEKTDDSSGKPQEVAPVTPESSDEPPATETVKGLLGILKAQNNITAMNQMAKGGNQILAALTRTPLDNSDYDKNIEQAQELPKQFGALAQQQQTQDENDPNSPESVAFRDFAKKLGYNAPPNMTASLAKSLLPALYHSFDVQEAGKNRLAMNQQAVNERMQAAREHNDLLKYVANLNNDTKRGIAETNANARLQSGATSKQNDALKTAQQLLESARGNPAAAQAEKDLYSAQKADSLANLYGDSNQLSPQQVQLLASEVGKIATGGVPTMHELEGLTPGTLRGALSSVYSKLVNEPTPAHAADFVKQYQDYTRALRKDAQKVINDKYSRIIEARKGQLGEDNYNALKDQYLNRFNTDNNLNSQEDKDALDWAKSNLNDPRAKKILKLHGLL